MHTRSSRASRTADHLDEERVTEEESASRSLPPTVHGSCVELRGRGALVIGKPGAGKSSLAIELISLGASLVGDDQVVLSEGDGIVVARALSRTSGPKPGAIEARQIGILEAPVCERVALMVVIDLDRPESSRLPRGRTISFGKTPVPLLHGQGVNGLGPAVALILRSGRLPAQGASGDRDQAITPAGC